MRAALIAIVALVAFLAPSDGYRFCEPDSDNCTRRDIFADGRRNGDGCAAHEFEVELASREYDAAANTTTFCWSVSSVTGEPLGFFTIGLCDNLLDQLDQDDVFTAPDRSCAVTCPADGYGDSKTGLRGVRFEVVGEHEEDDLFCVRLPGEVALGTTHVAATCRDARGSFCSQAEVPGPECCPPPGCTLECAPGEVLDPETCTCEGNIPGCSCYEVDCGCTSYSVPGDLCVSVSFTDEESPSPQCEPRPILCPL